MRERIIQIIRNTIPSISPIKNITAIDVIQILLIAIFVYYCILWIKNTRAYTLLKGMLVIVAFLLIAYFTEMQTILWIFGNMSTIVLVALVIIFQPELRRALEQLGERNYFRSLFLFENMRHSDNRISDQSINEIVEAVFAMAEVKTGALIVLENDINLTDYEKTGIGLDAEISNQLLINIFEHNTPLHDGAVLIRNNRVRAATCYLPLTENNTLSKHLGTRHRAAIGLSEVCDALTIVVSEETGRVSYAMRGSIRTNVAPSELRDQLRKLQNSSLKTEEVEKRHTWKGRELFEKLSKK